MINYYLESDNDTDCYLANLFLQKLPEPEKWFTVKELKEEYGFNPWLGKPPQAGRYKIVIYGN